MRSQAKVRVPATTANIGPGFDVLGLALGLYNQIEILTGERGDADFIEIEGTESGTDVPLDESNYVARGVEAAFRLAGRRTPDYVLRVTQEIPVSRGLGSSAAALVGGAFCANALMDDAVDASELVFALVDIEGHVEQLAAAAFGGLAAATPAGDQALPGRLGQASQTLFSLPVDDELIMALAVPDLTLETKRARAVLPHEVAFSDAVFNVAAATALVSGLADGDGFLIRVGMQDKLHQDARAELVPASLDVLAAARDAGAYGAAWSGAGPTMLGICGDEDAADDVAYAMTGAFEGAGIESEALVLKIDTLGCVTTELDGDDVALPEPAATPDDPSEARDGDDT